MKSLFEKLKKESLAEVQLRKIKGGKGTIIRTVGSSGLDGVKDPVYSDGSDSGSAS